MRRQGAPTTTTRRVNHEQTSSEPLSTPDDLRRILREYDVKSVSRKLCVFFSELSRRRHLMGSVLYPCLTDILGSVFGFDTSQLSWFSASSGSLYPRRQELRELFNPTDGTFFNAIFKYAQFPPRYEVPYNRLTNVTRHLLETGNTQGLSPLYLDEHKSKLTGSQFVEFEVNEYFFYLFVYYPLHPASQRVSSARSSSSSGYSFGASVMGGGVGGGGSSSRRSGAGDSGSLSHSGRSGAMSGGGGGGGMGGNSNQYGSVLVADNSAYFELLRSYLEYFFPVNVSHNDVDRDDDGGVIVLTNERVFLLMIADFWLHQNEWPMVVNATSGGSPLRGVNRSMHHNSYAYEYARPSRLVLEGISVVLDHFQLVASKRPCPEFDILRKPLFHFFRAAFCRMSLSSVDQEFKLIVNMWRGYLRPWMMNKPLKKSTSSSRNARLRSGRANNNGPTTPSSLLKSFFGGGGSGSSNDRGSSSSSSQINATLDERSRSPEPGSSSVMMDGSDGAQNGNHNQRNDKARLRSDRNSGGSGASGTPKYTTKWRHYVITNCAFYLVCLSDFVKQVHAFDYGLQSNCRVLYKVLDIFTGRLWRDLVFFERAILCGATSLLEHSSPGVASSRVQSLTSEDALTLRHMFFQLWEVPVSLYVPILWQPNAGAVDSRSLQSSSPYRHEFTLSSNIEHNYASKRDVVLQHALSELQMSLKQSMFYATRSDNSNSNNKKKKSRKSSDMVSRKAYEDMLRWLGDLFHLPDVDLPVDVTANTSTFRTSSGTPIAEYENLGGSMMRLTSEGRKQIKEGRRVCSNSNVPFVGDVWDRPKTTRESQWALFILHWISEMINRKLIGRCNVSGCLSIAAIGSVYEDDELGSHGLRCWEHGGYQSAASHRVVLRVLADRLNILFVLSITMVLFALLFTIIS